MHILIFIWENNENKNDKINNKNKIDIGSINSTNRVSISKNLDTSNISNNI